MHYRSRIYLFLLFLIVFVGCGKQGSGCVSERMQVIGQGATHSPGSALVPISRLTEEEGKRVGNEQLLELYVLETRMKLRQEYDFCADTTKLTLLIDFYSDKRDEANLAKAYLARGRVWYDTRRYWGDAEKAIADCLEAKTPAEKRGDDNLLFILHKDKDIGDLYYMQHQKKEAVETFKIAQSYAEKLGEAGEQALTYGKIASIYYEQPDSALVYQLKGVEYIRSISGESKYNQNILRQFLKNIGSNYINLKKPKEAKNALLEAYSMMREDVDIEKMTIITLLSDAYIGLGQVVRPIATPLNFLTKRMLPITKKHSKSTIGINFTEPPTIYPRHWSILKYTSIWSRPTSARNSKIWCTKYNRSMTKSSSRIATVGF